VDDSFVLTTSQRRAVASGRWRAMTVNGVRWLLASVVALAAALPCWALVSLGGTWHLLGALAFLCLPAVALGMSARLRHHHRGGRRRPATATVTAIHRRA
jgi:hypothetical protein